MRLISRLFALLLLVSILAFTNLFSSPSKADGGVCENACDDAATLCQLRCAGSPAAGCSGACETTNLNCKSKCRAAFEEAPTD